MSRGRKSTSASVEMNWQQIFNKNIGFYLQNIIIELGRSKLIGKDTSHELITKIKAEKAKIYSKENTSLPINLKEIPFEIPSNWQWCRLGELYHIERGSSPRPKGDPRYFSKIKTEYNWITISDMTAFAKDAPLSDTKEFLTELGTKHSRYVTPKDIIVVASGSAGRTSLLGIDGYIYDGLMAVKNIQDDVMRNFLFYMFKVFQTSMMDVASGATWQNINTDILKNQLIPIPPLSEQILILSFLNDFEFNRLKESSYFNKEVEQKVINLHKSQLAVYENFSLMSNQLTQIENLNQAILQEAVQGKLVKQDKKDEPASELLKRIKVEKAKSGIKEKTLPPIKPEEIPFEIPENWVWCRLGEIIFDTDGGKSPNCFHENVKNDEWGVIKTTAVQQMFFLENENKILPKNFVVLEHHKVFEDDVLITRAGPQNRVGVVCCVSKLTKNLILSDKTIRFKHPKHLLYSKFLATVYNSPKMKPIISSKMVGMAESQVNISQESMKTFLFPLPPLSEQKRIVSEIEKQLAKTKQLKEHILANQQATEQLLKALLHQAFLPVPQAGEVEEKDEV